MTRRISNPETSIERQLLKQIHEHEKAQNSYSLLGNVFNCLYRADEDSLQKLQKLEDSDPQKFSQTIKNAINKDRETLSFQKDLSSYGAGFFKTMGLFMRGRYGLLLTAGAYGLDETRTQSKNIQETALDLVQGSVKGLGSKAIFSGLSAITINPALKGVLLGSTSRVSEIVLSRENYQKNGVLKEKLGNQAFHPLALTTDAITFSIAHGSIKSIDKVSTKLIPAWKNTSTGFDNIICRLPEKLQGLLAKISAKDLSVAKHAQGYVENTAEGIISRRPLLATMCTGATFGATNGAAAEIHNQLQDAEKTNKQSQFNIDWKKVVQKASIQASLDGIAAIPGGIQADTLVKDYYWHNLAKDKPQVSKIDIPEKVENSTEWKIGTFVAKTLQNNGVHAYFVGGGPRDILLMQKGLHNKLPKDYDIVCNATPRQVASIFKRMGLNTKFVGEGFGVVKVIVPKGISETDGKPIFEEVDVATIRSDGKYSNGRKPDSVKLLHSKPLNEALREDASRRDFTINSLFIDPVTKRLIDYTGGKADLYAGIIRTVQRPDITAADIIKDDRLRMLRACRFYSRYGFNLAPELLKAIKDNASSLSDMVSPSKVNSRILNIRLPGAVPKLPGFVIPNIQNSGKEKLNFSREIRFPEKILPLVDKIPHFSKVNPTQNRVVSYERIRDELKGILESARPVEGLDLLMETGVMSEILPEVVRLNSQEGDQDPVHHPEGNTWLHTRMVLNVLKEAPNKDFSLMLAGLLHDIGKPDTQLRKEGGRISNNDHDKIGADIANEICSRFRLPGDLKKQVKENVNMHMVMHQGPNLKPNTLNKILDRTDVTYLIELQHADAMGRGQCCGNEHNEAGSRREFYYDRLAKRKQELIEIANKPKSVIDSAELKSLGLKGGPSFGAIVDIITDKVAHSGLNKEDTINWLKATNLVDKANEVTRKNLCPTREQAYEYLSDYLQNLD